MLAKELRKLWEMDCKQPGNSCYTVSILPRIPTCEIISLWIRDVKWASQQELTETSKKSYIALLESPFNSASVLLTVTSGERKLSRSALGYFQTGCFGPLETNQGGEAKGLAAKGSPAAAPVPRAALGAAPRSAVLDLHEKGCGGPAGQPSQHFFWL